MKKHAIGAVLCALTAAVFYALNTPLSKYYLQAVSSAYMASLLYFGAGIGVGILYVFHRKKEEKAERLEKADLPATVGMVLLDILAPISLMLGLRFGSASSASLLGNFEIVATALIALLLFREKVSGRLWIAIGFISLASILLTLEGGEQFRFSVGSLFVLLAASLWGLENNCTRKISHKSTYEIVTVKGLCSGLGAFLIALAAGEPFPEMRYIPPVLLLGFVAYGLSIFLYVRAQRYLGAAKTSAYYAVSPFIGVLLSVLIHGERLTKTYFIALAVMVIGTVFVVLDQMKSPFGNEARRQP